MLSKDLFFYYFVLFIVLFIKYITRNLFYHKRYFFIVNLPSTADFFCDSSDLFEENLKDSPSKKDRIRSVSFVHNPREVAQRPLRGDTSGARRSPSLSYATRWIAWGPRWVNYKVRRNALTPSRCSGPSFLHALSSALPSPSYFCEGPERPTSIQHFGSRYEYTFGVATVLRDTLDALRSFVRPTPLFPFPSTSSSTFFLLPSLLLYFLPWWISAYISSWHAQVVMCKKDEFYCGTRGDH